MKNRMLLLVLCTAACQSQAIDPASQSAPEVGEDEAAAKYDASCVRRHKRCTTSSHCCTGFCSLETLSYGPGQCVGPQDDGAYCTRDAQCKSGSCKDSVCAAQVTTCGDIGAVCSANDQCCSGRCELYSVYVPTWHHCTELLKDGAYCLTASECQSQVCEDSRCGAKACTPLGKACVGSAECCAGSFCGTFAYVPATCMAPMPHGSVCWNDSQCQSGRCSSEFGCVQAVCSAAGKSCANDGDCCAGFCDTNTYAPVVCRAAMGKGGWCDRDRQCQSGHCVNYACSG